MNQKIKITYKLVAGLSHLGDHKFRQNFQDCVLPMCSCGQDIETTTHFPPSLASIIIVLGKPSFIR